MGHICKKKKKIMTMQERKKRNLMRFAKHFTRIPFDLWILHYLSRKDICSSALFKRWVESMKRRLSFLHLYVLQEEIVGDNYWSWSFLCTLKDTPYAIGDPLWQKLWWWCDHVRLVCGHLWGENWHLKQIRKKKKSISQICM